MVEVAVIGAVGALAMLVRFTLMIVGVWKSPLLHRFERYANYDDTFYPWPFMMAWAGVLALAIGLILRYGFGISSPTFWLGMGLFGGAWVVDKTRGIVQRWPSLVAYPRWYADLLTRTMREERRHIAYRWLALPRRARWRLEAHPAAFTAWVDLVILSTVLTTVEHDTVPLADPSGGSMSWDWNY